MPHVLDELISGRIAQTDYASTLKLPRPQGWEKGRVWTEWNVPTELLTPWGAVFGGYLAALADELAGTAALSVLEEGETFGTVDLHVSPLRPIRGGRVAIEARVIARGRTTIHVEVEMRREDGTLAAKASAIQAVVRA